MARLFFLIIISCFICTQVFPSDKELKVAVVHYNVDELILPGASFPIGIQFVSLENGEEKIEFTKGFLKGTYPWRKLEVDVIGGSFQFGRIYVSNNLLPEPGKFVEIKIRIKKTGLIIASEKVALNFVSCASLFPTSSIVRAPGHSFSIGLLTTYDNGFEKEYIKNRQLRKELENFQVSVTGGQLEKNTFFIYSNPDNIKAHTCGVAIQHIYNTLVTDTFEIQLDYIDDIRFEFRGNAGSCGIPGSGGIDGCTGGNGGYGGSGGNGWNGGHGPDLEIYAWEYYDSILQTNLLRVETKNISSGKRRIALLNHLKGATFIAATFGGNGGHGGNGGCGGNGGNGKDGDIKLVTKKEEKIEKDENGVEVRKIIETTHTEIGPAGSGGDGGAGGSGGHGGSGGTGGNIYLHIDSSALQYHGHILNFISNGGHAGSGGSGGSGGRGGNGGSGNPNGSHGHSGYCGSNGLSGNQGYAGEVIVHAID